MKKGMILPAAAAVALAAAFSANAQTTVSEILFNEDGAVYDLAPPTTTTGISPAGSGVSALSGFGSSGVPDGGAFYLTGLGTLRYTVTGAGTHNFIAFVDDEADLANGFLNDYGFVNSPGTAASYLSWQIGDPSLTGPGSIGYDSAHSTPGLDLLDKANDIGGGQADVSFALGFDFALTSGETATIDLALTSTAPGGASYFYLGQSNGPAMDFYSGNLTITSSGGSAPDNGATWFSMLLGLAGLAAMKRFGPKFSKLGID